MAILGAHMGCRAEAHSQPDLQHWSQNSGGYEQLRTTSVALGRHLLEDVDYTVLSVSTAFLEVDDNNDLTVRIRFGYFSSRWESSGEFCESIAKPHAKY